MLSRTTNELRTEARNIVKKAAEQSLSDNECIQILCGLVDELAQRTYTLEEQVAQIRNRAALGR